MPLELWVICHRLYMPAGRHSVPAVALMQLGSNYEDVTRRLPQGRPEGQIAGDRRRVCGVGA
jgi:hypothetical protein